MADRREHNPNVKSVTVCVRGKPGCTVVATQAIRKGKRETPVCERCA